MIAARRTSLADSGSADLLRRRFEARRTVDRLRDRVASTDLRHTHAHAALQEALRQAEHQVRAIDIELRGDAAPEHPEPDTTAEARATVRARLHHLLIALDRHTPPSCEDAARRLRHGIDLELARLDADRR